MKAQASRKLRLEREKEESVLVKDTKPWGSEPFSQWADGEAVLDQQQWRPLRVSTDRNRNPKLDPNPSLDINLNSMVHARPNPSINPALIVNVHA